MINSMWCVRVFICMFVFCAGICFAVRIVLHWWLFMIDRRRKWKVCLWKSNLMWTRVSQYVWRKSVLKLRNSGSWGTRLNEGGYKKAKRRNKKDNLLMQKIILSAWCLEKKRNEMDFRWKKNHALIHRGSVPNESALRVGWRSF